MDGFKQQSGEPITFSELVRYASRVFREMREQRVLVSRCVAIASLAGLVVALGIGEEYEASTRLLPYKSGGGLTGVSSLASLAGVRLSGGSPDQVVSADLYPQIAGSKDFIAAVAQTPLRAGMANYSMTVGEYLRDSSRRPVVREALRWPAEAIASFAGDASQPDGTEPVDWVDSTSTGLVRSYAIDYLELLEDVGRRISVDFDRKTAVITITASMPDPRAAAFLARAVSARLMDRIVQLESRKAVERFRFVDKQYHLARARFENDQAALATFADRNRALSSAVAKVNEARLERNSELSFEVFQQLSRDREQALIVMSQDTPVFSVIEEVVVPTNRSNTSPFFAFSVSVLLGFVASVGLILLRMLLASQSLLAGHE